LHHSFGCPVQAVTTPVLAIALLLPSLFLPVFAACRPVLQWHCLDWLLAMIRGLVLGCLALAKNAIEGRTIAIKEPRHV